MSNETIKLPFQQGHCEECHYYKKDEFGSRQCYLNMNKPIRKIKECDKHLHSKMAKLLEEFKKMEG